MITYVYGDLFTSPASVLVNTVNTVGVMGKGIAKEFKKNFPEMFKVYQERCEDRELKIGTLFLYRTPNKSVLNFPTKQHWRSPSKVEFIEAGLETFVASYEKWGIDSVAFPQLGCGNGELNWEVQVRPLMERHLRQLPIRIYIHLSNVRTTIPEHRDAKWMKHWLNSEPESLPAPEVWLDLLTSVQSDPIVDGWYADIVSRQVVSPWAEDNDDSGSLIQAIRFTHDSEEVVVSQESILPIWRQLTTFGLASIEDFPPSVQASQAPLLELLLRLEYLQPAQFASLQRPEAGLTHGVKLLPRPARQQRQLELLQVS